MDRKIISAAVLLAGTLALASCAGGNSSGKVENVKSEPTQAAPAPAATLYKPGAAPQGAGYPLVVFTGEGASAWTVASVQSGSPFCVVSVPAGVDLSAAMAMADSVVATGTADAARIYAVGPSAGTLMARYGSKLAASMIVDGDCDPASLGDLAKLRFIYFAPAQADVQPLKDALEKASVHYTYASWPSTLTQERQDELAAVMLEKGAPVNIFQFEDDANATASAYGNTAARTWLLKQTTADSVK